MCRRSDSLPCPYTGTCDCPDLCPCEAGQQLLFCWAVVAAAIVLGALVYVVLSRWV
jgi:hypothetical protein